MIRKEAVKALGFLKIKDQRFIKGLTVMAVSDKDSDVRVNTIRVLGNLGFEPVIILGVLIQGLSDKSYNVSQEAAKSIGATKSDLFLAPLIYLLQDEVEVVNNLVSLKAAAATALGELGDKRALSALKEAAERYAGVREIAAAVRRAINKIQRITT
jgi:HEAT repeat protein